MLAKTSICLPVFNGERFLAQAIESALNQTYGSFELLISDDCSLDSSPEIIARYARQDSRIKSWRNTSNLGLFANYNKCLQSASGSFLKPFAQDDILDSRIVEKSVAVLTSEPEVTLVSVARNWIDEDGKDVCNQKKKFVAADAVLRPNFCIPGPDVISRSLIPKVVNFIGEPSTVTFRRNNLGDGFDESLFHLGDLEYWLRILLEGNFYYLNETLCQFRHHKDSSSMTNSRGLLIASDLMKLCHKWSSLLEIFGCSEEQFLDQVVEDLATHLSSIEDVINVDELRLRTNILQHILRSPLPIEELGVTEVRLTDELLSFRELAYHALRRVDAWRKVNASHLFDDVVCEKEAKIVRLEGELRELLGSPSWKVTKIFRDSNPFSSSKRPATVENFLLPAQIGEKPERVLKRQEEYLRYLQSQKDLVLTSKSWLISQPLRWGQTKQRTPILKSPSADQQTKSTLHILSSPDPDPQHDSARSSASTENRQEGAAPAVVPQRFTDNKKYEYQLAVHAIFRNEGPRLKEWIEFHRLVGVEHFFLFNNHSSDDYLEIIEPYVRSGLVDLLEWPGYSVSMEQYRPIQVGSMDRAVQLARGRVKWLASMDIDEFLFAVDQDSVAEFLSAYDDVGGLAVNWQGFGSSGVEKIPQDRLLIETLHRCAHVEHPFNHHVKSVVRPERVIAGVNSHFFEYRQGYGAVNSDRVAVDGQMTSYVAADKIRINHYWSGDLQWLWGKKIPDARKSGWNRAQELVEEREVALNQEESDRSIMRFAGTLREKMGFDPAAGDTALETATTEFVSAKGSTE